MEKVSKGANTFAIHLHQLLSQDVSDENVCLSPYNVFSSLLVVYLGSRGQTAKQLSTVLGLYQKSTAKMHEICAWIWFLMKESGAKREELLMANQLFIHADIDIRMDYDQWADAYYNTIPASVSFTTNPEACRRKINQWIQNKTSHKMQDLIPEGGIHSKLSMLCINVAYLKGLWRGAFPEGLTYTGQFHCAPNALMPVDMMYKQDTLYYGDFPSLGCVAVLLPISWTQGWMTILLPYKNDNIAQLEYRLTYRRFKEIRKRVKKHRISLHLPKFRLENSMELSAALPILGIADLFEEGKPDLSAMLECPPEELAVSEFVHKACIEVDESGRSVSYPKTKFSWFNKDLPTVEVTVDRPFLFFVQDGVSKIIVFSGHVVKPMVLQNEEEHRLDDTAL